MVPVPHAAPHARAEEGRRGEKVRGCGGERRGKGEEMRRREEGKNGIGRRGEEIREVRGQGGERKGKSEEIGRRGEWTSRREKRKR